MENAHEILGIKRNASPDEIKSAYRKMALKYHPDRNGGSKEAENMFKKVSNAYASISRKDSDSFGGFWNFGEFEGMDYGGGFSSSDINLGKDYEVFEGDARVQMPNLIKKGYEPLSVADVLQNRLKYGKDFPDWKENAFDAVADGVAYSRSGDAKIVLDADFIKNINSDTGFREGVVVLGDNEFESLNGKNVFYLPKDKLKELDRKRYTKKRVKDSEVWNFLARDNKLLSDYADEFFPEMRKRIGEKEAMPLYFDLLESNFDKGHAWHIGGLGHRSNAGAFAHCLVGRYGLDYVVGRFVGFSMAENNLEGKANEFLK